MSAISPWARLQEGNTRWIEGRSTADDSRGALRRAETTQSQNPFALILGCSDSRVPAEILFDQGLGDLFVVRTAGHVLDGGVIGSIEYAVEVLGVSLIVVLGHQECGAVAAAARLVDDAQIPPGYIRDVAGHIAPSVLRARAEGARDLGEIGRRHSLYTVEQLRQRSHLIDDAFQGGSLSAVATQYCLASGTVAEVHPHVRELAAVA